MGCAIAFVSKFYFETSSSFRETESVWGRYGPPKFQRISESKTTRKFELKFEFKIPEQAGRENSRPWTRSTWGSTIVSTSQGQVDLVHGQEFSRPACSGILNLNLNSNFRAVFDSEILWNFGGPYLPYTDSVSRKLRLVSKKNFESNAMAQPISLDSYFKN